MSEQMYDFSILRDFRKRAGLTIEELSGRSGVSPAVISKLERNQTSAELATLFRLAKVFGMNASDLLMLAENRTAHVSSESSHASGGFLFREIRYANCRLLVGDGEAGGTVSEPKVHQDDFEICWALSGSVRISLPHENHLLKAGECVQFDAILPHTYEVVEDCRVVICHLRKEKRF